MSQKNLGAVWKPIKLGQIVPAKVAPHRIKKDRLWQLKA